MIISVESWIEAKLEIDFFDLVEILELESPREESRAFQGGIYSLFIVHS